MTVSTQSQVYQEKRKHPRIKYPKAVEYRIFNPDRFLNDTMYDISQKGLSLLIEQQIPEGINVNFQTKLNKNVPAIFGKGKIVWAMQETSTKKFRVGVEITEIDTDSTSRLAEFLQNNNEQPN